MIDNPADALRAGHDFRKADVDIIFLYSPLTLCHQPWLPVVRRAKVPVIILNLSPEIAIDYAAFNKTRRSHKMTGEWLANVSACPVPEIATSSAGQI